MFFGFVLIVAVSLVLQSAAAVLAVRLVRVTGVGRAWIIVASALALMAARRVIVLADALRFHGAVDSGEFWGEAVGLLISVLLLAGVAGIRPLLDSIQRGREALQTSRDDLERQVAGRTAELVGAHEQLSEQLERVHRVEAALREEHRHLSDVLKMHEQDRQIVAYEIHDGFVQPASAALMNLQAAMVSYARDPDKSLENVVRSVQLLQESLALVRRLIRGLRPEVLEDCGLVAAVDELVGETEAQAEIRIDWSHSVQFDRLSPLVETAVFRVVQESLANAVRHSGSQRVEIELSQAGRTIHVRVQDWGVGFDAAAPTPDHFGLEAIRHRARVLGGKTEITSAPGAGTCIRAEFPLLEKDCEG